MFFFRAIHHGPSLRINDRRVVALQGQC